MRRILRTVVGTRPELDLRNRWWHRLVLVGYVAFVGVVAVVVVLIRGGTEATELFPSQRVVITDLFSFTEGFKGSGNPAAAFDTADGWLGFDVDTQQPTWFDVAAALVKNQFVCKPGGRVFGAKEGAVNIVAAEPEGLGTKIEPMPNRPGDTPDVIRSVCWGPSAFSAVPASKITKFKPTISAVLTRWITNAIIGAGVAAAVALLLAVAYYRSVIYVVFGGKTSS